MTKSGTIPQPRGWVMDVLDQFLGSRDRIANGVSLESFRQGFLVDVTCGLGAVESEVNDTSLFGE